MICVLPGACHADDDAHAFSCPEHQEGFDASCYEFVSKQQSFLNAQGWCERGGGHLAFILNDEIQQFLLKHLEPGLDWWLGLAPAAPNLTLDTTATDGKINLILVINKDNLLKCSDNLHAMCLFAIMAINLILILILFIEQHLDCR